MVSRQHFEVIDEFENKLEHHEQSFSIHLLNQVYLHQSSLHVIGRQVNHDQYVLDLKGVFETNNHNNYMYLNMIPIFFLSISHFIYSLTFYAYAYYYNYYYLFNCSSSCVSTSIFQKV